MSEPNECQIFEDEGEDEFLGQGGGGGLWPAWNII